MNHADLIERGPYRVVSVSTNGVGPKIVLCPGPLSLREAEIVAPKCRWHSSRRVFIEAIPEEIEENRR